MERNISKIGRIGGWVIPAGDCLYSEFEKESCQLLLREEGKKVIQRTRVPLIQPFA